MILKYLYRTSAGITSWRDSHSLGSGRLPFMPHLYTVREKLFDDFVEKTALERFEDQSSSVDTGLQFKCPNGRRLHTGYT